MLLTSAHVRDFYAEHLEKSFFGKLQQFMSSGPIWALVLAKQDAVAQWRSMMGPTDSLKAKAVAPGTLRALYGTGSFDGIAAYLSQPCGTA
jgi:nucleoside diphosphate kinase